MTAILKEEPADLSATGIDINPALEKIYRRCLEKKQEQRFHSAHDLAFALEALSTVSGSRTPQTTATSVPPQTGVARLFDNVKLAWIVAGVLMVGLLAALPFAIARFRQTSSATSPVVRYDVFPANNATLALVRWPGVAVSPDGSTLAYVATSSGITNLYIRKRDDTEARVLAGTEGASDPAFSPNGRWIAFIADFTLKKVPVDGPVSTVIKVGDARGISWANDDTLIYSPESAGGLAEISANGGEPKQVSKLDESKKERTHRWPQVLPGGKAVIFTVGTLDTPDSYERSNLKQSFLRLASDE
jgi:serine/threonine-protein kinase